MCNKSTIYMFLFPFTNHHIFYMFTFSINVIFFFKIILLYKIIENFIAYNIIYLCIVQIQNLVVLRNKKLKMIVE